MAAASQKPSRAAAPEAAAPEEPSTTTSTCDAAAPGQSPSFKGFFLGFWGLFWVWGLGSRRVSIALSAVSGPLSYTRLGGATAVGRVPGLPAMTRFPYAT